ncbi:hypothetical protein UA08_05428 [Talaromyces atroroseus]|uniref:Uncharacterized protein n=1 Tax=Talaromyces atroroseus TaxID=1441469 RepID=A0A225AY94_TALAT|nr:hypothetical protein UA08_05428 [Talaromyces atroroseus]OKL59435.1 hypothetical protein UA08_05428 [Talaromyces atroroseus]
MARDFALFHYTVYTHKAATVDAKEETKNSQSRILIVAGHLSPSQDFTTASAGALSVLTSIGGIIGYARTGSIPSIAAGLSVGALYLLSLLRLRNNQPYGEELGLLASTVLGGASVPRAIRLRKPVPVALSVLATYGLLVFGLAFRDKRASRV